MIDLIKDRLEEYETRDPVQKLNVVKEILQEIALFGLWRTGFFEKAAFQGGTILRILHGMPRFSEDLDFILKNGDPRFDWASYLKGMVGCFDWKSMSILRTTPALNTHIWIFLWILKSAIRIYPAILHLNCMQFFAGHTLKAGTGTISTGILKKKYGPTCLTCKKPWTNGDHGKIKAT